MSPPITISKGDRSAIRVFAINAPPDDIAQTLKTTPKPDLARQLLNAPHLNTASAEIFPVEDLSGLGLSAYLSEGYAVDPAQLTPDRQKLDALEGYVLLVFSDSFAGVEMTLAPGATVTLIGTYREITPATTGPSITAKSAKPYSGTQNARTAPAPRPPARSTTVAFALVVLLGLGLWWLLT
ncbi:hypothetical protein [Roseobacter sp.]|uniref:hypothetical protein n=1 Tax=Roseobacter sp. TaxID=1907202 RepID=UPI00329A14A7